MPSINQPGLDRPPRAAPARGRVHYAWVVAGVTFLALLASAGIRATSGVLVLPLGREFGWDLATISLALSINLLLYGLCAPFAGAIMATFGVRRVMVGALCTLAVAVGTSTLMQSAWQLVLLWGVLVGLGSGAMALVLGATVAARWFVQRRGLVTGLFAASTATGQLVFLPLQAAIIEFVGWRTAVLLVAGVALTVAAIVGIFMRDDPRQVGLQAYGADNAPEVVLSPGVLSANPFKLALQTLADGVRIPDFWFLAGSFAICGATTVGLISVHLIPASVEHGMTEVTAASMLAAMGIFDLIGTTASGLAVRPHRSAQAAGLVLHAARAGAAVPARGVPAGCAGAGRVRRVLRAGLGRHRPADGQAGQRALRQGPGRAGLRLDFRGPSTGRLGGGDRCWPGAQPPGRLPAGLAHRWRPEPGGGRPGARPPRHQQSARGQAAARTRARLIDAWKALSGKRLPW